MDHEGTQLGDHLRVAESAPDDKKLVKVDQPQSEDHLRVADSAAHHDEEPVKEDQPPEGHLRRAGRALQRGILAVYERGRGVVQLRNVNGALHSLARDIGKKAMLARSSTQRTSRVWRALRWCYSLALMLLSVLLHFFYAKRIVGLPVLILKVLSVICAGFAVVLAWTTWLWLGLITLLTTIGLVAWQWRHLRQSLELEQVPDPGTWNDILERAFDALGPGPWIRIDLRFRKR